MAKEETEIEENVASILYHKAKEYEMQGNVKLAKEYFKRYRKF